MFWKAFESRITSDASLTFSILDLYENNLIPTYHKYDTLCEMTLRPFQMTLRPYQSNLVTNVVKDVLVTRSASITTESFTFFLTQGHYAVLYKKWKDLGKKNVVLNL